MTEPMSLEGPTQDVSWVIFLLSFCLFLIMPRSLPFSVASVRPAYIVHSSRER